MRAQPSGLLIIVALIALVAAIVTGYIFYVSHEKEATMESSKGVIILVTFRNLADDIDQIVCKNDRVYSIVPPGVDPHTYSLSIDDVKKAKEASLVISTAHAPFELQLREKIDKSKLIEIPSIPGMRIENIVGTSTPNLHMPIYDPQNYIIFIKYVSRKLAQINTACAQNYTARANEVIKHVEELVNKAPRLDVDAVGSTPLTQYAVEWLGVRIKALLMVSPEVGVTAESYSKIKEMLADKKVSLAVIVTKDPNKCDPLTKADEVLNELAEKYGIQKLCVPAPFLPGSIPSKLKVIVTQAKRILQEQG
jgi:zinc/manganese transport system substrate-binding protein